MEKEIKEVEKFSELGEQTLKSRPKSYEVTYEFASDKTDIIIRNRIQVTQDAQRTRTTFIRESPENLKAVNDFIFGESDDNPLEKITKDENSRYDAYNDKIEELARGVKAYINATKNKKLNQ